jgi:hypothetical protein
MEELRSCLYDDLALDDSVRVAISSLRKRLRPDGYEIMGLGGVYRMVRHLASPYDGKR